MMSNNGTSTASQWIEGRGEDDDRHRSRSMSQRIVVLSTKAPPYASSPHDGEHSTTTTYDNSRGNHSHQDVMFPMDRLRASLAYAAYQHKPQNACNEENTEGVDNLHDEANGPVDVFLVHPDAPTASAILDTLHSKNQTNDHSFYENSHHAHPHGAGSGIVLLTVPTADVVSPTRSNGSSDSFLPGYDSNQQHITGDCYEGDGNTSVGSPRSIQFTARETIGEPPSPEPTLPPPRRQPQSRREHHTAMPSSVSVSAAATAATHDDSGADGSDRATGTSTLSQEPPSAPSPFKSPPQPARRSKGGRVHATSTDGRSATVSSSLSPLQQQAVSSPLRYQKSREKVAGSVAQHRSSNPKLATRRGTAVTATTNGKSKVKDRHTATATYTRVRSSREFQKSYHLGSRPPPSPLPLPSLSALSLPLQRHPLRSRKGDSLGAPPAARSSSLSHTVNHTITTTTLRPRILHTPTCTSSPCNRFQVPSRPAVSSSSPHCDGGAGGCIGRATSIPASTTEAAVSVRYPQHGSAGRDRSKNKTGVRCASPAAATASTAAATTERASLQTSSIDAKDISGHAASSFAPEMRPFGGQVPNYHLEAAAAERYKYAEMNSNSSSNSSTMNHYDHGDGDNEMGQPPIPCVTPPPELVYLHIPDSPLSTDVHDVAPVANSTVSSLANLVVPPPPPPPPALGLQLKTTQEADKSAYPHSSSGHETAKEGEGCMFISVDDQRTDDESGDDNREPIMADDVSMGEEREMPHNTFYCIAPSDLETPPPPPSLTPFTSPPPGQHYSSCMHTSDDKDHAAHDHYGTHPGDNMDDEYEELPEEEVEALYCSRHQYAVSNHPGEREQYPYSVSYTGSEDWSSDWYPNGADYYDDAGLAEGESADYRGVTSLPRSTRYVVTPRERVTAAEESLRAFMGNTFRGRVRWRLHTLWRKVSQVRVPIVHIPRLDLKHLGAPPAAAAAAKSKAMSKQPVPLPRWIGNTKKDQHYSADEEVYDRESKTSRSGGDDWDDEYDDDEQSRNANSARADYFGYDDDENDEGEKRERWRGKYGFNGDVSQVWDGSYAARRQRQAMRDTSDYDCSCRSSFDSFRSPHVLLSSSAASSSITQDGWDDDDDGDYNNSDQQVSSSPTGGTEATAAPRRRRSVSHSQKRSCGYRHHHKHHTCRHHRQLQKWDYFIHPVLRSTYSVQHRVAKQLQSAAQVLCVRPVQHLLAAMFNAVKNRMGTSVTYWHPPAHLQKRLAAAAAQHPKEEFGDTTNGDSFSSTVVTEATTATTAVTTAAHCRSVARPTVNIVGGCTTVSTYSNPWGEGGDTISARLAEQLALWRHRWASMIRTPVPPRGSPTTGRVPLIPNNAWRGHTPIGSFTAL